jgi:hypothetical protein
MVVHSALLPRLAREVDEVLTAAGISHVAHGVDDPVAAGEAAAQDDAAVALIAETVEASAPAQLPLLAPMATWAGVTRDDEPGCDDDPARHLGTVFRLLARDTEVAARIAEDVRSTGRRALVVAGDHEYGLQLDGQLRLAGLPRAPAAADADLVVLCGLADEPEIERTRSLAPLPVVAFDGVQGADLGPGRDVQLALPYAPSDELSTTELFEGVGLARHAAGLVVDGVAAGALDRGALLEWLRGLDGFDEHGDPVSPDVWLWSVGPRWTLEPRRALLATN